MTAEYTTPDVQMPAGGLQSQAGSATAGQVSLDNGTLSITADAAGSKSHVFVATPGIVWRVAPSD